LDTRLGCSMLALNLATTMLYVRPHDAARLFPDRYVYVGIAAASAFLIGVFYMAPEEATVPPGALAIAALVFGIAAMAKGALDTIDIANGTLFESISGVFFEHSDSALFWIRVVLISLTTGLLLTPGALLVMSGFHPVMVGPLVFIPGLAAASFLAFPSKQPWPQLALAAYIIGITVVLAPSAMG